MKQQKRALCAPLQAPVFKNLTFEAARDSMIGLNQTCPAEYSICMLSLQLCLTLCNPMDHRPPGSFVHGIFLARILEWFAMPSSEAWRIFWTQGLNLPLLCRRQILHLLSHLGKPQNDLELLQNKCKFLKLQVPKVCSR